MGIKLSSSGGLTFSQQKGLNNQGKAKKLVELSRLSINKPILERIEKEQKEKKARAADRRSGRIRDKNKTLDESTED